MYVTEGMIADEIKCRDVKERRHTCLCHHFIDIQKALGIKPHV
jgi:hypothetical protein